MRPSACPLFLFTDATFVIRVRKIYLHNRYKNGISINTLVWNLVYFCWKLKRFNMGVYGDWLAFRVSLKWALQELWFLVTNLTVSLLTWFSFHVVYVTPWTWEGWKHKKTTHKLTAIKTKKPIIFIFHTTGHNFTWQSPNKVKERSAKSKRTEEKWTVKVKLGEKKPKKQQQ